MKIIIDLRSLVGGQHSGIEIYTKTLLRHLQEIDKENHYYLFSNSYKSQHNELNQYQSKNFQIVETNLPNKFLNLSLSLLKWPKIDRIIQKKLKQKIDFDLFFMPDLRPFALSKDIKSIGTIHDLSFQHFPNFFSWKSKLWYKLIKPVKLIRKLDQIISVSEFTKEDIIKTFKIKSAKIEVIHLGTNKLKKNNNNFINTQKKYHLPGKYILFLSTLQPRKNLEKTIEAFQIFKNNLKNSEIKLVIAGVKNYKLFASKKLSIPKQDIILTGFIEEKDKYNLFKNALVFLYPSLFEGFGLPILEAMSTLTPVVTSHSSSMTEIGGDAAILVNPSSSQSIADGIMRALKEKEKLIDKMKKQIQKFKWEKCTHDTLNLFKKLK